MAKLNTKKNKTNFDNTLLSKVPPQAIDFEEKVLSMCFRNKSALLEAINILKPEMFYKETHQLIFKSIISLNEKNSPVDIILLKEELIRNSSFEEIGGISYLLMIDSGYTAHTNVEYYCRIILQKYMLREFIKICSEDINNAFDNTNDPFDVLEQHEKRMLDLWNPAFFNPKLSTKSVSSIYEDLLNNNPENSEHIANLLLHTGWSTFDTFVETRNDKIVMIAGAASEGKSRFVASWMFRILKKYPNLVSVNWITLEDSAKDVSSFYFSQLAMISIKELKRRKINENQKLYLQGLLEEYRKFDIEFVEISDTIESLTRGFEKFCVKREKKFNIMVIDNMLAVQGSINTRGNTEVSSNDAIMKKILNTKQKTKGLIICIHHFKDEQSQNISANLKTGFRPNLTSMKGSEAFYRIPDQVLLINAPRMKKQLINDYIGPQREILNKLMIVDPGKIRDDTNVDDTTLMYFYAQLDYAAFFEIPKVIK
jgi:replicative DNA helicase